MRFSSNLVSAALAIGAPAVLGAQRRAQLAGDSVMPAPVAVLVGDPARRASAAIGPTLAGARAGLARAAGAPPVRLHVGDAAPAATPGDWRAAFATRAFAGTLGAAVGGLGGFLVGTQAFGSGGGDDAGLAEGLVGSVVGLAFGGALGAALPERASTCSVRKRLGLGLLGAGAGTVVGVLAGSNSGAVLITAPLGAGVGAAGAATVCGR